MHGILWSLPNSSTVCHDAQTSFRFGWEFYHFDFSLPVWMCVPQTQCLLRYDVCVRRVHSRGGNKAAETIKIHIWHLWSQIWHPSRSSMQTHAYSDTQTSYPFVIWDSIFNHGRRWKILPEWFCTVPAGNCLVLDILNSKWKVICMLWPIYQIFSMNDYLVFQICVLED